MPKPSFRVAPIAVAALLAVVPAVARAAADTRDTWLGLYFQNRKIGYTSIHTEDSQYHGQPALKIASTSVVRMEVFGNKVSQDTSSTTWTDRSWRPVYQEFQMTSNGSATRLRAEYLADKIVCTLGDGTSAAKREVPVPAGTNLSVDSPELMAGRKLTVGQTATFYYLNPLTLSLDRSDVKILGKGQVKLAGVPYTAYKVLATSPFGDLTSWQTAAGDTLSGDMPLGMRMYREPKQTALNMKATAPAFVVAGAANGATSAYRPPADFAVATAVKTDRPIARPRSARALSIVVSGVENPKLVLSDARQQASPEPGQPRAYRVRIAASSFDPAKSVTAPVTEPSVHEYLQPAPYLESGAPEMRETAQVLTGKETNAYKIASGIRAWVHENMRPDYTIGIPRSCTDIYKRRRGVCRDYATLFAGIARAAGIPTRVVGGMLYANGRFFYHAWDECWVGEWVPFDPTLGEDFVDATHVKFAQGDVTDMFNVGAVIGRIKVKVLQEK